MSKTNFELVQEFHNKFNCHRGKLGHLPSIERVMLRTRLMVTENSEAVEAMALEDYVNVAKELADALYVIYGTADEYGIPIDEVFLAVHESNMTKTGAKDSGGKIVKGDHYIPPNIERLLEQIMQNKERK